MAETKPEHEKEKLEGKITGTANDMMLSADFDSAQVKSVDMSEDMQQEAIEVGTRACSFPYLRVTRTDQLKAQEAMATHTIEKEIAHHIKRTVSNKSKTRRPYQITNILKFDERKGATWHCIVGRNFGSFVTHETKHFIYFYLGHCAILLFKTQ